MRGLLCVFILALGVASDTDNARAEPAECEGVEHAQPCDSFDHDGGPRGHWPFLVGSAVIWRHAEYGGSVTEVSPDGRLSITTEHGAQFDIRVDNPSAHMSVTHSGGDRIFRHIYLHPREHVIVAFLVGFHFTWAGHALMAQPHDDTADNVAHLEKHMAYLRGLFVEARQGLMGIAHGNADTVGQTWCLSDDGLVLRQLWFFDPDGRPESLISIPRGMAMISESPYRPFHPCDDVPCLGAGEQRDSKDWADSIRTGSLRSARRERANQDAIELLGTLGSATKWPDWFTLNGSADLHTVFLHRLRSPAEWTSVEFSYDNHGIRIEQQSQGVAHGEAWELGSDWAPVAFERWFDGLPDGAWWAYSNDRAFAWVAHFIAGHRAMVDSGVVNTVDVSGFISKVLGAIDAAR